MTYRNYLAPNYTGRASEAAILRTVLDIGPLTIEEVRTKQGAIAYKFQARQHRRIGVNLLTEIERAIHAERERKGLIKSEKELGATYRSQHRQEYNARKLQQYRLNKDAINAKRRAKRAEQLKTKQAMQELPNRV